jgi:hypothetical protein
MDAQGRERMAEARQRLNARKSQASLSEDEDDEPAKELDEDRVRAEVCGRACVRACMRACWRACLLAVLACLPACLLACLPACEQARCSRAGNGDGLTNPVRPVRVGQVPSVEANTLLETAAVPRPQPGVDPMNGPARISHPLRLP